MAKRNKNKVFPFIVMAAVLGFGIFVGAIVASPQYRYDIFAKVNDSRPATFINEYLAEQKIEYAFVLPTGKDHPALRRSQNR